MIRRKPNEYQDPTLFPFKWALPIKFFIGVGFILSSFLPSVYSLICGLLLISGVVIRNILARFGMYTDPLTKRVIPGRRHAVIDGDYVVFLIGARPNRIVDPYFKEMGDSFEKMVSELEKEPSLGYLGSDSFIGATGTCSIQYWKDTESLNSWAANPRNTHLAAWKKLSRMGKASTDYAFWHETHKVSSGQYESVYVNCPQMLLGNCKGVKLVDIDKETKLNSAAGRMGDGKKEE